MREAFAEVIDFGIYKGKYALVFKIQNGKNLGARS